MSQKAIELILSIVFGLAGYAGLFWIDWRIALCVLAIHFSINADMSSRIEERLGKG